MREITAIRKTNLGVAAEGIRLWRADAVSQHLPRRGTRHRHWEVHLRSDRYCQGCKSLDEAMTSNQPIVDSIGALIAPDFKDLEDIFVAANADVDIQLRKPFNESVSFRNNLLSQLQNANVTDGDNA